VPDLRDLTAQERTKLESLLTMLSAAGVDVGDSEALGGFYDEKLSEWHRLPEDQRPDVAALVDAIGAGVGECIVRQSSLRWVVATDPWGTDLALHGDADDFLFFPLSSVAKRWRDNETGFVAAFVGWVLGR
jgi:hypothetical protein